MSNPYRKLERKEVQLLQHLYVTRFREHKLPDGGQAELWWRVCEDFNASKYAGSDIVLKSTRELEFRIAQDTTLSKEYIDALLTIVHQGHELSEHQKLMILLTATNEDRMKAAQLALM